MFLSSASRSLYDSLGVCPLRVCIATRVLFACCFSRRDCHLADRHASDASSLKQAGGPAEDRLFRADARGDSSDAAAPPLRRRGGGAPPPRVRARDGRGGDTDAYLGPRAHAVDASVVERRPPRVSRRSQHLELDALLAHGEVDVARAAPSRGRRPVAARPPRCRPVEGAPAAPAASRRRGRGAASPGGSRPPPRARSPCVHGAACVVTVLFGLSCTRRLPLQAVRDGGVVRRPRDRPEGDPRGRTPLRVQRIASPTSRHRRDAARWRALVGVGLGRASRATDGVATRTSASTPSSFRAQSMVSSLVSTSRHRADAGSDGRATSPRAPLHAVDATSKTKKYHAGGNVRGSPARSRRGRTVLSVPQQFREVPPRRRVVLDDAALDRDLLAQLGVGAGGPAESMP